MYKLVVGADKEALPGDRFVYNGIVYTWAKVESLEAKIEKAMMTLTFRTYMSGSGRPTAQGKPPSNEHHEFVEGLVANLF